MIGRKERGRWRDRVRASLTLALAATLGTALAPPSARAAGYHYPDRGAAALARGGAFVARADDPTALYYNPAGAARLGGTRLLFDARLLHQRQSFTRLRYGEPGTAPTVDPTISNDDGLALSPFVALTSDLGGLLRPYRLVLLAGVYGPNAHPTASYPRNCLPGSDPCQPASEGDPAPQRYDTVRTDIFVIYPSLGLAWQPIDGLSVGGVFQLGYAEFGYQTVVGADRKESPLTDLDVRIDNHSDLTPTGIVGAHWRALPFLEIGASVRFGFSFETEGDLCTGDRQPDGSCAVPPDFALPVVIDPNPVRATLEIPMEWTVRTGLRYVNHDGRARERFDLELDFVWESTSALQRFDLRTERPINVFLPGSDVALTTIESVPLEHGWHDTWSLRFGGSYQLHDLIPDGQLILRGGTLYEPSPMPNALTRLDFTPLDRIGLTLGLALRYGRYQLDLTYAHLFHLQRRVASANGVVCADASSVDCGSQVRKIVPLIAGEPEDKFGDPVGNGTYDVAIDQVSIGATVAFGE